MSVQRAQAPDLTGLLPNVRVYGISGSPHTYTKPTTATFLGAWFEGVGAGGASGSTASTSTNEAAESGCGGAGGYFKKWVPAASIPATLTLTVGVGGTAAAAGNNAGNNGGDTTVTGSGFSTLTGAGGTGGNGSTAGVSVISNGGVGGGASGGDVNIPGGSGSSGRTGTFDSPTDTELGLRSGLGGESFLSTRPRSTVTSGSAGGAGSAYGGGGTSANSGASQAARAGGAGADGGLWVIEEYAVAVANEVAWTAWTPALTATTTNPTLGSGSQAVGRYIVRGKTVTGYGRITFGTSGVAAGSGQYLLSVPVSPLIDTVMPVHGVATVYDSSAALFRLGAVYNNSTTTLRIAYDNSTNLVIGDAAPWVWAASDAIFWEFTYELA